MLFRLPLVSKKDEENNERIAADPKPIILLADTSPFILTHIAGAFELANFEVKTAMTAHECISLFKVMEPKPDIILMNGAMAGDAGVSVIISVRRAKPDQKIMVVVEEDNARAMAMKVGADVVVMKPITAEAVVQKVNEMLSETESFLERKRAKFERRK